eukprot:maker-scaffold_17-snap-gene-4.48-mRNA-1 protein AED:0.06 eAED:0.06 QI:62/1/1/1/1/1/4/150/699
MEEIAECIADHQYNTALKQKNNGESNLADSILDLMPEPHYFYRALDEIQALPKGYEEDKRVLAQEKIKLSKKNLVKFQNTVKELKVVQQNDFKVESLTSSPIGRFLLGEALIKKCKKRLKKKEENEKLKNITSGRAVSQSTLAINSDPKGPVPNEVVLSAEEIKKVLKILDQYDETKMNWSANQASKYNKVKVLYRVVKDNEISLFSSKIEEITTSMENIQEVEANQIEGIFSLISDLAVYLVNTLLIAKDTFFNSGLLVIFAYRSFWFIRYKKIEVSDFVVFRDLGRGAFGVVSGARHRVTGKMFAIKTMNRRVIKGRNCKKLVIEEKTTLELLGNRPSNFSVGLKYCFFDHAFLYLVLPLLTGGDLSFHLGRVVYKQMSRIRPSTRQSQGDEDKINKVKEFQSVRGFGVRLSVFYAAEIFLGISHLHNLGLIYRDLKPENVLLSESGHARISDLGLAVQTGVTPDTMENPDLKKGRAGTPGYWPPEMINGEYYGFDADWWAYGATVFELFYGVNPFSERITGLTDRDKGTLDIPINCLDRPLPDPKKLEKLSSSGLDTVTGSGFEVKLQNLLNRLMSKVRNERIGVVSSPRYAITTHPCFETIDWAGLETLSVDPPWVPSQDNINAEEQSDIETRNREHEFRKVKLDHSDDEWADEMSFTNKLMYHRDVVDYLELEISGQLKYLKREDTSSSLCCLL